MMTQTTGKHTVGAVKAAQQLISDDEITPFHNMSMDRIARIIDEETHAGELVTALRALFEHCAMVHKCWGDGDNTKEAAAAIKAGEAAIKSATGQG